MSIHQSQNNDPAAHNKPGPGAALARLALLAVGVAVVLAGLGWLPTRAIAGDAALPAMGLGIGLALLATLAGLVPPVLATRSGPRERTTAALAGMGLRFALMLALLGAALLAGVQPRAVLAIWAALGYLVLLAVDTAGLVWLLRDSTRKLV